MYKKFLLAVGAFFYCATTQAQVVTSSLDPMWNSLTPSATGRRDHSVAGIHFGTGLKGDFNSDMFSQSDPSIASGADDTDGETEQTGSMPPLFGAYKAESIAAELYYMKGVRQEVNGSGLFYPAYVSSMGMMAGNTTCEAEYITNKLHTKMAYLFGESLNIGLGYRKEYLEQDTKMTYDDTGVVLDQEKFTTEETGMALTASYKIGVVFLAIGAESVTVATNDYKRIQNDNPSSPSIEALSFVNTIYGISVLFGEPDDFQVRAEYGIISSPETISDGSGSSKGRYHGKTTSTNVALEVKYGNYFVGYNSQVIDTETPSTDLADDTIERLGDVLTTTNIGLGWVSNEGISLTAYSVDLHRAREVLTPLGVSQQDYWPRGIRCGIGWNF